MNGFFFQAEDGIRVWSVTGVQTCALPIFVAGILIAITQPLRLGDVVEVQGVQGVVEEIGRASCRERVSSTRVGVRTQSEEEVVELEPGVHLDDRHAPGARGASGGDVWRVR